MISIKALAAILPLVATINGHMIMKTPIPYGKGSISNAPLDASGSDFPCKNVFELANGDADINHMAVGSTQTLSFTGSAVHGGGSCQVSLTKDLKPTKDSKWMVIKSIEGSCPAGTDGNLPADPNGSGASTFQYQIPEGISPGEYTIAWTWVNKIGNREFYMNCGRADITAPTKKRYAPASVENPAKRDTSFPDLFVANLAGINSCKTTEGIDIQYPNPGPNPIISTNSNVKFGPPVGDCGASGSSSGGSDTPTSTSASAPAATTGGSAPGVFASGAATVSPAATTTTAAAAPAGPATTTTATAAPESTPSASAAPVSPVTPVSPSGAQSQGSACSPEGQWACAADGQSFQRCASGIWSAPIAMAAGTSCTPGTSSNLQMTTKARFSKRLVFKRRALTA